MDFKQLLQEIIFRFAEDDVVRILSIGQIRPEKNHRLQLDVVRQLKQILASKGKPYKVSQIAVYK